MTIETNTWAPIARRTPARTGLPVLGILFTLLAACSHSHPHASTTTTTTTTTIAPASLAVSAVGSVNAVINGGAVSTSLVFNSSETAAITNLAVTAGLAPLPAGWSGPGTFSCASVTTGSGCILNLTYAPTAIASGNLVIQYSYTDSAGAAKTGSTTIAYAGTTNNNVTGTPSPAGQIVAIVGAGSQSMTVTFDTDDGNPATTLALTTDLTALPAGWSSAAHTFTCASVTTGTACQLPLTFAPTAVGSGTLTLSYNYVDNFGTTKTGTVNIPYAGTVHDNVVASAAPSPVYSAVGNAAVAVPVTFTTDDSNPATALTITSSLTSLPAGWSSSATSFSCSSVSTGTGCQLPLSFTAAIGATGTLQLTYGYVDNAGTAKTGSLNIMYTSATHNNILGSHSPTGTVRAAVGDTISVPVIFNTDDQNIAGGLAVTTGLASLPAYWTGPASFTCTTVSTGSSCQLNLSFAPLASVAGTVTLGYSYTDSAGTSKTGTVNVPYAVKHVYVTDYSGVYVCSIVTGGTLSGCTLTALNRLDSGGNPMVSSYGITFAGGYAYVNQYPDASVATCAVNLSDGTLANCTTFTFTPNWDYAYSIFASDSYLYAGNSLGAYCAFGANGIPGSCGTVANTITNYAFGIYVGASRAYVALGGGNVQSCQVTVSGDLTPCTNTGVPGGYGALTVSGNFLYVTPFGGAVVNACPINSNGSLGTCVSSPVAGAGQGGSVATAVYAQHAYTITPTDIEHCAVDTATGLLSSCAVSDGGASFTGPGGVGIY